MWLVSRRFKSKSKKCAKVLNMKIKKRNFQQKMVSGDICPDLNVKTRRLGGGVWFKELITAGNCPECEKPDDSGNATGANGSHNDKCLNSLWQAPFTLNNIKLKCTNKYNDRNGRSSHYKSSPYGTMPYYRLAG